MKLKMLLESSGRNLYNTDGKINLSATKEAMDFMTRLFKRPMASDRKVLELAYRHIDSFTPETFNLIKEQKASEDKNVLASLAILGNELNKPNADKDIAEEIKTVIVDSVAKTLQIEKEDERTALIEKLKSFGSSEKSSRAVSKIISGAAKAEEKPAEEPTVPAEQAPTQKLYKQQDTESEEELKKLKDIEDGTDSTKEPEKPVSYGNYLDIIRKIPEPDYKIDQIVKDVTAEHNKILLRVQEVIKQLKQAKENLTKTTAPANESVIVEAINMENSQEVDKFLALYTKAESDLSNAFAKFQASYTGKSGKMGRQHIILNPSNFDRNQTVSIKKESIRFLSLISQIDRNLLNKELPSTIQRLVGGVKRFGKDVADTSGVQAAKNVYSKIKEAGKNLTANITSNINKNDVENLKDYFTPEEKQQIESLSSLAQTNPSEYAQKIDEIVKAVKQRGQKPEIINVKNAIVEAKKNPAIAGNIIPIETEFTSILKQMISSNNIDVNKLNEIKAKIDALSSQKPTEQKTTQTPEPKRTTANLVDDFKQRVRNYLK